MDEAERCHEIAYIAKGVILARGTTDEVIAASGLHALAGDGPGADQLAADIQTRPGVSTAAAFGTVLHVCGTDPFALRKAVEPWEKSIHFTETPPTLEDVFIDLVRKAANNSAEVA